MIYIISEALMLILTILFGLTEKYPINICIYIGCMFLLIDVILKVFKKKCQSFCVISQLVLIMGIVSSGYLSDFYKSDETAENAIKSSESVLVTVTEEGTFFDGKGKDTLIIFYPGAKVEYKAYAPLMKELAEKNIDCFLVNMPYNFAIFGSNKADKIIEKYNYKNYYIMGHSLGGAFAANYVANHLNEFKGAILLAAYPTKSLKSDSFKVLSIYGSEDGVLNKEKIVEGRKYMPEKYTEYVIMGGNHAQFGSYGRQKGDGEALISSKKQIELTIQKIIDFI